MINITLVSGGLCRDPSSELPHQGGSVEGVRLLLKKDCLDYSRI